MSRHEKHIYLPLEPCACIKTGTWLRLDRTKPVVPSLGQGFDRQYLKMTCSGCGQQVYSAWRSHKRDLQGARCTLPEGTAITATTIVSFVGYAMNKHTAHIQDDDIEARANLLIAQTLGLTAEAVAERWSEIGIQDVPHRWLRQAARKRAKYLLLGEAFAAIPSPRSIWHMDKEVRGVIEETVCCWTGKREPGHQGSYGLYSEDDWEPPYLWGGSYNQLYVVRDRYFKTYMVHPNDVTV